MKIDKAKIRDIVGEQDNKSHQRVSAYTETYKGEYYNIEIDKLIPFRNQSRRYFDQKSLEELANTIKTHGIRQPLTILPSLEHNGKYEIISGERRWRAARIAGLNKVPSIIIHNRVDAEEIALIENIQRQDLHPLELMQAFQSLLDRNICKSTKEIAEKIGVSKSMVVETLALKKLPMETQQALIEKGVKARNILRELGKTSHEKHSDIITNYENDLQNKVQTKKLKIMSIMISNNIVSFQDNKIEFLTDKEKVELKKSLVSLAHSLKV